MATPSVGDLDIITAERGRIGKELAAAKALPPADPELAKIIAALPAQAEKMLAASDQLVSAAASTEQTFAAQVKAGIKLGDDAEALRSEYQTSRSEGDFVRRENCRGGLDGGHDRRGNGRRAGRYPGGPHHDLDLDTDQAHDPNDVPTGRTAI